MGARHEGPHHTRGDIVVNEGANGTAEFTSANFAWPRRYRDPDVTGGAMAVGGAPLNEEFGKAVGADAYCRDAAIAVETAKGLIAARRAGAAAH